MVSKAFMAVKMVPRCSQDFKIVKKMLSSYKSQNSDGPFSAASMLLIARVGLFFSASRDLSI